MVDRAMPSDRSIRDKATIRAELERRTWARQVITYGEAAALVGRSTAALMPVLAAIRDEETRCCRPDLTALVVTMSTGLPRGVGAGPDTRDKAIAVQEAVFAAWA